MRLFLKAAVSGLARSGLAAWRRLDGEPRLDLRPDRDATVLLVLQGLDGPVAPVLHFDHGEGFSAVESLDVPASGTVVWLIDLRSMPDIVGLRLVPGATGRLIRAVALQTGSRRVAGLMTLLLRATVKGNRVSPAVWLLAPLALPLLPFLPGLVRHGPVRSRRLSAGRSGLDGRGRRTFRSLAEHYHFVVGLYRAEQAEGAGPPADAAPVLSLLVPVYNTRTRYLDDLLASFRIQAPGLARLVLSDDGSTSPDTLDWLRRHEAEPDVHVVFNARNAGIAAATNSALAVAHTPWCALLDHDDALSPGAVATIVATLRERPDATFLYTDEAIADGDLVVVDQFLKPDYDPVFLSGANYINHFSVYRTDRLRALGGLRDGFQGSQDYDLLLRYLDGLDPATVLHLPYPAYIWRRSGVSFSAAFEVESVAQGRRALAKRYAEAGRDAVIEPALFASLHRVRFDAGRTEWPRVTVVIPSRDHPRLIARTLDGVLNGTDYPHLSVIVVDNGSTDRAVLRLYEQYRRSHPGFRAEIRPEPFNFSRSVNRGMRDAGDGHVLLLNNDVEVLDRGWLKEMASCLSYEGTGLVGARLLYPDRTLQHAGVLVGMAEIAGHWYLSERDDFPGPMARLTVRQSVSAVTGAVMLISRPCLQTVGLFDEERFAIAFNDVDYCLRAAEAGFRTVWTPFATLIHHESVSRGSDERPETIQRFRREQAHLKERHGTQTYEDRALNVWYSRDFHPIARTLPALPRAR